MGYLLIVLLCLLVQVMKLVSPIASVKRLKSELILAPDLPEHVVGDEKRLMQTILNVVGNAVKFTKEGVVMVRVYVNKSDMQLDPRVPEFIPTQDEHHCNIRVEVQIQV